MKYFTITLVFFALVLIGFNITLLDFNNLVKGDSAVALIGISASLCAVMILLLFRISKKIEQKLNGSK